MKIHMTQEELDSVAEFLNAKYEEWRAIEKREGRRHSMSQFARSVGLKQPTMSKYMKLGPQREPVEGMDTPILIKFYDRWGDDFMRALRGDATRTEAKAKTRKR